MKRTAESPPARRYPFLPANSYIGWTPYVWLMYLPTFFIEPIVRTRVGAASPLYWTVTLLGTAIFLAAYFRGYWVCGRKMLAVVGVLIALGAGFAPINTGSFVFFIYAACFAAQLDPARHALRVIAGIMVVTALTAWATGAPLYFWTSVIVAPLLGGVLLHFAQADRANRRLLRAQEEIEQLAKVAERERIARDLHDVLGHTLSLIVLKAELAGKLTGRDPQRAAREIGDIESVARQALRDVRDTIRGYRATLGDEVARARAILIAAGIHAEAEVQPCTLDRAREEAIALALRESVTNVARHSAAANCRIRLAVERGVCVLDVEDDGAGGPFQEGAGLRGMRERAEALGGELALGRVDGGRWTRLRVSIPFSPTGARREEELVEATVA